MTTDEERQEYEAELSREVYGASELLERLERKGLLFGNGHHMRQKVATFAVGLLKSRWIKENK